MYDRCASGKLQPLRKTKNRAVARCAVFVGDATLCTQSQLKSAEVLRREFPITTTQILLWAECQHSRGLIG